MQLQYVLRVNLQNSIKVFRVHVLRVNPKSLFYGGVFLINGIALRPLSWEKSTSKIGFPRNFFPIWTPPEKFGSPPRDDKTCGTNYLTCKISTSGVSRDYISGRPATFNVAWPHTAFVSTYIVQILQRMHISF